MIKTEHKHSQFAKGMIAGLISVIALLLVVNAAMWLMTIPGVGFFVEQLTQPRFSIVDIVGALIFGSALLLIAGAVVRGPRFR